MEKTSSQTQCPVSKILQRYIKELKHLISLVFSVRTVNYGSSIFPSIYSPRAKKTRSVIYSTDRKLG